VREHKLQEAANGVEAFALIAAATQPFDAIVLVLQMPDMNGVDPHELADPVRQACLNRRPTGEDRP
jgi:CheY-like chemotaxis protein